MVVYVKEDVLSIEKIKHFVRENVILRSYKNGVKLKAEDFLMISRQRKTNDFEVEQKQILIYEDLFEQVLESVIKECNYNFDYYYLKNAILKAEKTAINTVVTGSSYGLFGIEESMLSNAVNLSLASQDLYYSIKGIEAVCNVNSHIKNIVLCCSHYYLFSDLSKSRNSDSIQRMSKVYVPLFGDAHNAFIVPPKSNFLVQSCLFDVQKIMDVYSISQYEEHYFNFNRVRENFALRLWSDKAKNWNQLEDYEKEAAARERALLHNRNKKRDISLSENINMLNELSIFCNQKGINLIIVVAPASKYYVENIWPGFQEIFYETLENIDGVVHLLDLYTDEGFVEEDYIDMDHLSDLGARKVTENILSVLQTISSM